jgi:hypothetical protein
MLRETAKMRVTSSAGTDRTVDLRGAPCGGTAGLGAKPGAAAHWPAGLCLAFPGKDAANGVDQPFAIRRFDPDGSKFARQHVQGCRPGPARRQPDGPHVSDVKLYELPKLGQPSNPRVEGRFVAVNRKLR